MTTRIAFLRAVNVGRRRVSMGRVVDTLGNLGYDGVWTHANSGTSRNINLLRRLDEKLRT